MLFFNPPGLIIEKLFARGFTIAFTTLSVMIFKDQVVCLTPYVFLYAALCLTDFLSKQ